MSQISQLKNYSALLAGDLAAGLHDAKTVFENHGLTEEEGLELLNNPRFQEMLKAAQQEWASVSNTHTRLKLKAQIILEQSLIDLFGIVTSEKQPAAARVAAVKELKDIAKVTENEGGGSGTSLPPIQIVIGGAATTVEGKTIDHRKAEEAEPADDGSELRLESVFGASDNDDLLNPGAGEDQQRSHDGSRDEEFSLVLPELRDLDL